MTDNKAAFQGQVVLVTGSARRVGKSIALAFAAAGANLVIHHSSSPKEAAETAAEARELGAEVLTLRGDHQHMAEIRRNFAEVWAHFGRLDALVNNASIFTAGALLDIPTAEWEKVMAINLSAPLFCTQEAAKLMRDNGGGVIINIADNSGLRAWATRPHHSISKAGLIELTRVSAKRLAQYQIRVGCVVPGPVLAAPDMSAEYWQKVVDRLPLKRGGDPDDVARAVLFLAGQPNLNGTILQVDGGEYLGSHA